MKCKSCKEDVPAKFAHAISANICPLCGEEIMAEKLRNALGELKIAMTDAKEFMPEIEDWLFSNFSLKKIEENMVLIDKEELSSLQNQSQKRQSDNSPIEITEENNRTIFAKRAGVPNHKKTIDFIKGQSTGAADMSEFVGLEDEDNVLIDNNETEEFVDPNSIASIFKENKQSNHTEIQKLKKLQGQSAIDGGGGGAFRRNS